MSEQIYTHQSFYDAQVEQERLHHIDNGANAP